MIDLIYIHPGGMTGLCNAANQLVQLVCVVLSSVVLAAGAHGYFQALSTEHCMALRDAVIGQRLDHIGCAVVQGYHAPGDGTRQKVTNRSLRSFYYFLFTFLVTSFTHPSPTSQTHNTTCTGYSKIDHRYECVCLCTSVLCCLVPRIGPGSTLVLTSNKEITKDE